MSDNRPKPTKRFAYPFKETQGERASAKTYHEALARAEDGFYPIGVNGQWHGGIHFGVQTAQTLPQDEGLRCIADGEVIAYRIDNAYPQVDYPHCAAATYSTGFVLVRHHLEPPPPPQTSTSGTTSSAATPETATHNPKRPSLTCYSLYMHLLDWSGYQTAPKKPRPNTWGEVVYVVADKANDQEPTLAPGIIGLRVRDAQRNPIAILPRGTQLRLGAAQPGRQGFFAIDAIITGNTIPDGIHTGFVYKPELDTTVPNPITDTVVVLEKPLPIAAGDLVGYLGQYQRFLDVHPLSANCAERALAHIEVFTGDDIDAFIANTRAYAARLPNAQKTLLKIHKGARLIPPPSEKNAPSIRASGGIEVGHTIIESIATLKEVHKETDGTRWFEVTAPDTKGNALSGWIREKEHPGVTRHSPWEWPGFERVQPDGNAPATLYAHHLTQHEMTAPDEREQIASQGRPAKVGSLFRTLYEHLDQDSDKRLTELEIRRGLGKPWLAEELSRLIMTHDSEWSGPMSKWDDIDHLIPEPRKADWQKEKERIRSLLFWDEVKGKHGFPESPKVHHLHPVGLVKNLYQKRGITIEMLRQIFTDAPESRLQVVVEGVNDNIDDGMLNTEERLTHFFGQVRQEVGSSMAFRENLRYSADGLFNSRLGYYRGNRERSERDAKNEEAIANNAYADANRSPEHRLGNTEPGDGWRYRGRGLKQLTGRDNYRRFTAQHAALWGAMIDFEKNPDLLEQPSYAVRSGLVFWLKNQLYLHADSGITRQATDKITKVINSGTDSYAQRWGHVERIWALRVFKDAP